MFGEQKDVVSFILGILGPNNPNFGANIPEEKLSSFVGVLDKNPSLYGCR